jgi:type III pantothenate kinase
VTSSICDKHDGLELVLIDVGNTSTHFVYYSKGRFVRRARISTADLSGRVLRESGIPFGKADAAVVASVVPAAGDLLKKMLPRCFGLETHLIDPRFAVPIINRYKNPRQVGTDRLVNAAAAYHEFNKELIIVDFGTAITFDVVSRKGEYLGGVIAPGIEITLDALFQKTALLPRTHLEHPKAVIGRDTAESIRIGCSYGIGGLCDRIIELITKRHKIRPVLLATGGYALFMARYCHHLDRIDSDLTMKGILLTYKRRFFVDRT